jgi:hypothetical protein
LWSELYRNPAMPPKLGRNKIAAGSSANDSSGGATDGLSVVNSNESTDDICVIIDKAINAAMAVFKTELLRLINDKFDSIAIRLKKLEEDYGTLHTKVTGIESEVATQRVNSTSNVPSAAVTLGASSNRAVSRASLAAIHIELAAKQKRSSNIIISGLAPSTDKSDAELFVELCEDHLPIKPGFVHDSCRRLGKPLANKIQPLLVTLNSTVAASDVLSCAGELRKSSDASIKSSVYINADLTPAEALAAFEERVRRRERRQRMQDAGSVEVEDGPGGASGGLAPPTNAATSSPRRPSSSSVLRPSATDYVPGSSSATTGAVSSKLCV